LFGKLKAQVYSATLSRKVVVIAGDVTMPDLGLSVSNRQLLIDRDSSIFRVAATIRFGEALNTRGTKLMLEHAQDMQKLEVWPRCSYNPIRRSSQHSWYKAQAGARSGQAETRGMATLQLQSDSANL
jgi:hypothetical protein